MNGDQLIFGLWCFMGFLLTPIVICWILFGIAWLKGWRDPEITPLEILERLSEPTCEHTWDLFGSNQGAHYVKCTKCGKLED